jgi:hypothetical protein
MRKGLIIVTLLSAVAALGMWVVDGIEVHPGGTVTPTPTPTETSVRFNDPGNSAVWYVLTNNVLYRYEDLSGWIDSRVTLHDVTYCDNPFPFTPEEMQTWSVENISGQFTPYQPPYEQVSPEGYRTIANFESVDLYIEVRAPLPDETVYSWARYRYGETPHGMGYEGYASFFGDPPFTSGYIIQFTGMNYQTNVTENVKATQ